MHRFRTIRGHRVRSHYLTRGLFSMTLLAALAGCDPTEPKTEPPLPTSCDESGQAVSGTVSGVWEAVEGPFHLTDDVTVDGVLTIEAGTLVCGAEGAAIVLPRGAGLGVIGKADSPVVLTAEDSLRPWGGIDAGENGDGVSVGLEHARIEHAEVGVVTERLTARDVVIREIQREAVFVSSSIGNTSTVRQARIENACRSGGHAAVYQSARSGLTLEDVEIIDSGCIGLYTLEFELNIRNVRIIGSRGIGFEQYTSGRGGGPTVGVVEGLTITGGADRPLFVTGITAARILDAVPVADLTGNAVDRIGVFGGVPDSVVVTPELAWEFGFPFREGYLDTPAVTSRTIRVMPGGHMRVNALRLKGRLLAEGDSADPVLIDGPHGHTPTLRFDDETPAGSRLEYVRMEGVRLRVTEGGTADVDNLVMRGASLWLDTPGSSLRNVRIESADDSWADDYAALFIEAPGVVVEDVTIRDPAGTGILVTGSDVRIQGCRVTDAPAGGIWVANHATGVEVHDCHLDDNGGLGLRNTAPGTVDATLNWWGDPAGPLGPDGAGVSGDVDFDPWLAQPPARP